MSAFKKLLAPQTKTVEFQGEEITIKKLPFLIILDIQDKAKEFENSDALRGNLEVLILVLTQGVVEAEGCEELIRTADGEMFTACSELSSKIMEFSGMLIGDTDETDG